MIRIGILGDIGSGKSFVAKNFGHPVFNADLEVTKLYQKDKKVYNRLNRILPHYFKKFPISKYEVSKAILKNNKNLKKIIKVVHLEVKKKLKFFLDKNKKKKIVILDIPLLLENKINNKNDILVFVQSRKTDILKRLKKRKNFNEKLIKKFRTIQLPLDFKKKKAQFIIKNNFTSSAIKKKIKKILKEI
jgi:dephospho-CoA kinase